MARESDPPLFVPRDLSDEVTAWMRLARAGGGFLLLIGTSSVGKTRLLFESARAELGDFRLLAPELGDGRAVNELAAAAPSSPVVVWLDELQRFLAGPYFAPDETAGHRPVNAESMRLLLDGDTPVIVLATLWPDHLDQLHATDTVDGVTKPRHPAAASVLALRTSQLRVNTFSAAEKHRASVLAAHDPRLASATAAGAEFNVTETLAGVPRIMQRYLEASATRQAVVHAAIDARRLGIQGVLTPELLRDAARGYLTGVHTDDTGLDQARTELARTDRRDDAATAPLLVVPTADHRDILGYTVADYLLQELLPKRRSQLLSDTAWNALIRHTHNPDDRRRLARQAERRMQYRHAQSVHHHLATAGDRLAQIEVVNRLVEQDNGREAETFLTALAAAGDVYATSRRVDLLVRLGRAGEAEKVLADLAAAGDADAAHRLIDTLVEQGRADEAAPLLAAHAVTYAAYRQARRQQESQQQLQQQARQQLQQQLQQQQQQQIDLLVSGAMATANRVDHLTEVGDWSALRALADAGNSGAASRVVEHLAANREWQALWDEVHAGTEYAVDRLIAFLVNTGQREEAERLRKWGLASDGSPSRPW